MNGKIIERDHVVTAMAESYNAPPVEQFEHNWKHVQTVVVEQGDVELRGCCLGFHLLERCLHGSHHLMALDERDGQALVQQKSYPGTVSLQQSHFEISEQRTGLARIQQVHLDPQLFENVAATVSSSDLDCHDCFGFKCLFDPQISSLMAMILKEARYPSLGSELYVDLLGQEIALQVLRLKNRSSMQSAALTKLSDRDLSLVTEYIEENLEYSKGVSELAGIISMDPYAFSRAFKAATGCAPHQFLIERRVERAKQMLLNTTESLAEIAYATGFGSQSHMTYTFSNRVGAPPGAWRKAMQ